MMYYTNLNPTIWDELTQESTTNLGMVVCLQLVSITGEDDPFLCVFVSSDKSLHFMCEVDKENKSVEIENPNVAGLEFKIVKNNFILNRERQDYYDLKCTGEHHREEFTNMIMEICDLIFNEKYNVEKAILTIIKRNTSFWGRPKNVLLNDELQRGLFGELYVLNELIKLGFTEAVINWIGPLKERHDFHFDTFSIEVKTTLSPKHKHIINGLEQLEKNDNRLILLIVSLKLRNDKNGNNISWYVRQIRQSLQERPDLIEEFNLLLDTIGYNDEHEDYYVCYTLDEHAVLPMDENFPTLTTDDLKEPIPARISKVNYTVDMEGLYHFKIFDPEFKMILEGK